MYHLILETLKTLKNLRGKLSVELLKIVLGSYALIISITLGISISHIFGTSHSDVFWWRERVPILVGNLTIAASALRCFWKKNVKENIFYYYKFNVFNPFVSNEPFLYPLKTTKNFTIFWCFQGVMEECFGNGLSFWINWGVNSLFLMT